MTGARRLLYGDHVHLTAITHDDLHVIAPWWSDEEFARPAADDPVLPQTVDDLKGWFLPPTGGRSGSVSGSPMTP